MAPTRHSNEAVLARYNAIRPKYTSDAAAHEALRVEFGYASVDSVRGKLLRAKRLSGVAEEQREVTDGAPVHVIPDGHTVKGVSSLVDADGTLVMQWIKTNAVQQQWQDIINAVLERIPSLITPRKPVLRMVGEANDLLALYPLADLHIGLYASLMDGGADWRLADTVALVKACIDDLIARTPAAALAVVANLGDLTHVDNATNMTPRSGNVLDADGRYVEIAQAAIELAVYTIDRVAAHHQHVEVLWLSGNHDGATSVVLRAALAMHYRDDSRVDVVQSGKYTHIMQHGQVALGFTHGDTIKSDALPLLMANDAPLIWAATTYRIWHCGHRHTKTVKEYPGCIVEVHQSPAPRDQWHEQSGYRSLHSMVSIIYDQVGEYSRNVIQIRHGMTRSDTQESGKSKGKAA